MTLAAKVLNSWAGQTRTEQRKEENMPKMTRRHKKKMSHVRIEAEGPMQWTARPLIIIKQGDSLRTPRLSILLRFMCVRPCGTIRIPSLHQIVLSRGSIKM